MSAPPMGMMSNTPNNSDRPTITGNSCQMSGRATSMMPLATAIASKLRLMMFWPR